MLQIHTEDACYKINIHENAHWTGHPFVVPYITYTCIQKICNSYVPTNITYAIIIYDCVKFDYLKNYEL